MLLESLLDRIVAVYVDGGPAIQAALVEGFENAELFRCLAGLG